MVLYSPMSVPLCLLHSVVSAPPLAPTPSPPGLLPSSPIASLQPRPLQPHSIRPMQLRKKPHYLVNHTSRGSGPGGESGDGYQQLRAQDWKCLSLGTPTHSLGLHFGANKVQSLNSPTPAAERGLETEAWTDQAHSCPWEGPSSFLCLGIPV